MSIVLAADVTHMNIGHAPTHMQLSGYSTGTADIKWTPEDWSAHPGSVRIDQDAAASDFTADELDVENGAATIAEAANWFKNSVANFHAARRPGQRWPSLYVSANTITPLVNELIKGGVSSGPGLHVANWNLTESQAIGDVMAAAGPFPIIGIQFQNDGLFDLNVYSQQWLQAVSGQAQVPPGQWFNATQWTWESAILAGIGLNGKMGEFHLTDGGTWQRIL